MYSLGIVMYKMLDGRAAVPADTPAALATRILLGNLPCPGASRSGLNPLFDEIFARATARDPAARYDNWEDFAADLRRISEGIVDTGATGTQVAQLRALPFFRGFSRESLAEVARHGALVRRARRLAPWWARETPAIRSS